MASGALSPQACVRITVDTTVQTKGVAHRTDAHLLLRAMEHVCRLARKHELQLRQSFLRLGREARREVARLIHGKGHKQALRHLRKMRTWLGRLTRDVCRKIEVLGERGRRRYRQGLRRDARTRRKGAHPYASDGCRS